MIGVEDGTRNVVGVERPLELELIEQWGSGVQRMTSACLGAGLPAPAFAEIALRFRVTLRTIPVAAPAADPVERQILTFLEADRGRSNAEIATHIGLTTRATQHRMARLADRALVVAIGSGPKDPRRRWFLIHQATAERRGSQD